MASALSALSDADKTMNTLDSVFDEADEAIESCGGGDGDIFHHTTFTRICI